MSKWIIDYELDRANHMIILCLGGIRATIRLSSIYFGNRRNQSDSNSQPKTCDGLKVSVDIFPGKILRSREVQKNQISLKHR